MSEDVGIPILWALGALIPLSVAGALLAGRYRAWPRRRFGFPNYGWLSFLFVVIAGIFKVSDAMWDVRI